MKNIAAIILVASSLALASDQPSRFAQTYYLDSLDGKPLFNETETALKQTISHQTASDIVEDENGYKNAQIDSGTVIAPEKKYVNQKYDDSNIQYKPSSTGVGGIINRAMGVKVADESPKKSAVGQRGVSDFLHKFLRVPKP